MLKTNVDIKFTANAQSQSNCQVSDIPILISIRDGGYADVFEPPNVLCRFTFNRGGLYFELSDPLFHYFSSLYFTGFFWCPWIVMCTCIIIDRSHGEGLCGQSDPSLIWIFFYSRGFWDQVLVA